VELTIDQVDESTLEQIQALLAKTGKAVRSVKPPRDRLEDLFLRIVREAQSQKVSTGGAVAGGAVAEFLRVGGGSVIDELVGAAATETVTPAPAAAGVSAGAAESAVSRDVLDQLENAGQAPPAAPAEISVVPTSKSATAGSRGRDARETRGRDARATADADRSVIDSLLNRDQETGQ